MHKLEQGVASLNIPMLPQEMTQTGIVSFNYRHWWDRGLHKLQAHTHLKTYREQKQTHRVIQTTDPIIEPNNIIPGVG